VKTWIRLLRSSARKWVFSLGVLSLASTSIDVAFAIDPSESLSELSRTQWNSRDGAPANMWQLAQTQDGYIWIGAFSGLFRLNSERFEPFTLPDGSHPLNKNISVGIDSDWQDAGSRRQAYYTNVPPGLHQFDVIAANQDGIWNTVGASTAIVIPTAFYQTRWFYSLCGIALLGLIWQIYRLRLIQIKNRLGERLRERERVARELHDTLIQSAQGLILIFQGFAGQLPKPDPMRKNMEIALDQADSLLNEARERVTDLRTTGIDSDVVQAFTHAGEDLFRGTSIQFSVVNSGRPLPLMHSVADDIFRIGREALTNASLHARAKSVEIEITFEPDQFRLRVRDDGVGISAEIVKKGARPNHFGLQGMRERAERLGGRLEIWGRASAGSEIDLKIPAKTAYRDLQRRARWIPSFFQQPPQH
jgi:signal transduction histidine kinase